MAKDLSELIGPSENYLKAFLVWVPRSLINAKQAMVKGGLGLASAYSIITRHDGYIELESQRYVGTTFYIYLPASDTSRIEIETRNEVAATGEG